MSYKADVELYTQGRGVLTIRDNTGKFNFLSKDQLTKKKDRILINDLISNK